MTVSEKEYVRQLHGPLHTLCEKIGVEEFVSKAASNELRAMLNEYQDDFSWWVSFTKAGKTTQVCFFNWDYMSERPGSEIQARVKYPHMADYGASYFVEDVQQLLEDVADEYGFVYGEGRLTPKTATLAAFLQ